MKCLHLLSACLIVVAGCDAPTVPEEHAADIHVDTLSVEVDNSARMLPQRYRAEWRMPDPDRWDEYWQQQYADTGGTLGMRSADFDGDGTMDDALLLHRTDTTQRDTSLALLVAFGNGRDTLLATYPWAESEGGIGMGLLLHPAGPLGHLGGEEGELVIPSPVQLEHPAVTMVFFEKGAITWFWYNGKFQHVWTGD
ncbi:MAG: hypothetical protein ABI599_08190 [Flavobacteriales bacterium]